MRLKMNRLLLVSALALSLIVLASCPQSNTESTESAVPNQKPATTTSAVETEKKPSGTSNEVAKDTNIGTKVGSVFPNLDIVSETGTTLNIHALKGKVVLVNCFAHYCGPCKEEMPMLIKHYQANKDKNYALVLLPFDSNKLQISQFYQKYGGAAYRREESVSEADALKMGIFSYPKSFLLDKNSVVRKIWMGVIKEEELNAEIAKLQ